MAYKSPPRRLTDRSVVHRFITQRSDITQPTSLLLSLPSELLIEILSYIICVRLKEQLCFSGSWYQTQSIFGYPLSPGPARQLKSYLLVHPKLTNIFLELLWRGRIFSLNSIGNWEQFIRKPESSRVKFLQFGNCLGRHLRESISNKVGMFSNLYSLRLIHFDKREGLRPVKKPVDGVVTLIPDRYRHPTSMLWLASIVMDCPNSCLFSGTVIACQDWSTMIYRAGYRFSLEAGVSKSCGIMINPDQIQDYVIDAPKCAEDYRQWCQLPYWCNVTGRYRGRYSLKYRVAEWIRTGVSCYDIQTQRNPILISLHMLGYVEMYVV